MSEWFLLNLIPNWVFSVYSVNYILFYTIAIGCGHLLLWLEVVWITIKKKSKAPTYLAQILALTSAVNTKHCDCQQVCVQASRVQTICVQSGCSCCAGKHDWMMRKSQRCKKGPPETQCGWERVWSPDRGGRRETSDKKYDSLQRFYTQLPRHRPQVNANQMSTANHL